MIGTCHPNGSRHMECTPPSVNPNVNDRLGVNSVSVSVGPS
jgi:hypothetical protein